MLKKNQTKLIKSNVDVFLLASDLFSRDAIPEAVYERTIDSHTGLTATERLVQLISSVFNAVKVSGGQYFDKLLQSLRECGQERLADELHQCYSEWKYRHYFRTILSATVFFIRSAPVH